MRELWIVSALIFLAVLLGIWGSSRLVIEAWRTRQAINRRLRQTREPADQSAALNARRAGRSLADVRNPLLRRVLEHFAQTGLRFERMRFLFASIGLTVAFAVAWSAALGIGPLSLLAGCMSAAFAILIYLETVRRKRIARFAELLPDAIDVIVRGVRVGYPLPVALELVARELPEPIKTEFGMTADEISFGQDVRPALANLYRRVGHEDLLFLVVAINVQTQTGGNLAEVLSRLSRLIRARMKLHLKVRALSAEGRVSAVVLSLMPFILFGGVSLISPSYFGEIRHEPLVYPALVYCALSLIIGNLVMYRMVNLRV
ncbi:MAG: type II secretion system F family protein [Xanthobacteraceae bacterium]|nr:type II secretion system F family protein [Xanthobacteraceae bacterium]